jgi:GntR family transcriptional regulator
MNGFAKVVAGPIPKYRQILQIIRNRILSGELPPETQLPTEEELSANFGVSRGTVRQAIMQLEAERLIRTEQGLGSFVRAIHPNSVPFYFTDNQTRPRGPWEHVTYEVLAQEVISAPMDVAERLSLAPGTPVIHVARLHRLDGVVIAHTVRYLPETVYPSLLQEDLTNQSVHLLLVTNSELPLLRAEIEIEAHLLNGEEAALLHAEPGLSALAISRLTYTAPNRPAVWYRGLFRESFYMGVRVGDVEQSQSED